MTKLFLDYDVYRLPTGWYWIEKPTFANSAAQGPFESAAHARANARGTAAQLKLEQIEKNRKP